MPGIVSEGEENYLSVGLTLLAEMNPLLISSSPLYMSTVAGADNGAVLAV